MTKEEFLERARNKHGYKYTYLNLKDKILSSDDIEIMYNDQVYTQKVVKHILLGRCPEKNISIKSSVQFIEESKKVWGNKKYDYSLIEYTGALNKVKIIYDGVVFEQLPISHLKGMSVEENYNTEYFIKKSKEKWGLDKYDYSLVEYINNKTKIKIIYGGIIYEQLPLRHLNGYAPENIKYVISNTSDFIERSKLIYGDKYLYDKTEFVNNIDKIIVTCLIHGDFDITPKTHMSGFGCPGCIETKIKKIVYNFLIKHKIKFIMKNSLSDCDFYIPSIRTYIEVCDLIYDSIKSNYCEDNYIDLIVIKFEQMNYVNEILSDVLLKKLKIIHS
jgi:hypothetical protein